MVTKLRTSNACRIVRFFGSRLDRNRSNSLLSLNRVTVHRTIAIIVDHCRFDSISKGIACLLKMIVEAVGLKESKKLSPTSCNSCWPPTLLNYWPSCCKSRVYLRSLIGYEFWYVRGTKFWSKTNIVHFRKVPSFIPISPNITPMKSITIGVEFN